MHIEFRRCGRRPKEVSRVWLFPYGFGVWLGRRIFTVGHDTRSRYSCPE